VIQGLDERPGDGSPVVYQARPIGKRCAQTSMSIRRKTASTKYPASRLIEFSWLPDRIWMPANSVGSSVALRSERPFCSEHTAGRYVGSRSHRQAGRLPRSSRISSQPAATPGRPASRSGQSGPRCRKASSRKRVATRRCQHPGCRRRQHDACRAPDNVGPDFSAAVPARPSMPSARLRNQRSAS